MKMQQFKIYIYKPNSTYFASLSQTSDGTSTVWFETKLKDVIFDIFFIVVVSIYI